MMREIQITQNITNRESRSVETYLNELGKVHLISVQEEVVLAEKIRQGDQAALDKLVKANLRFVVSVAKKYQNQGLPLADLISEGSLGLIRAAKRFDETRGFKFISFAVWWIRQAIMEAIAGQSRMIRLPMNQIGTITRINKTISLIEQQTERQPTAEELAEFMNTPLFKVTDALHCAPKTTSYDAPLSQCDDDFSLLDRWAVDVKPADSALITEGTERSMNRLLSVLTEREREIIELTYGLTGEHARLPSEISPIIGLSAERIRQIRNIALDKLRLNPCVNELVG